MDTHGFGGGMNEDSLYEAAVYVISVAADLAGMHPQTLRQYDRLGLVTPVRTRGRGRRYSRRDIEQLREIQRLSQEEGVNLAGISRIIELEAQVKELQRENRQLKSALNALHKRANRVFAAAPDGGVQTIRRGARPHDPTAPTTALVRWTDSQALRLWRAQQL